MSGIEIEREEPTVSALAFLGVKGEKRLLVPDAPRVLTRSASTRFILQRPFPRSYSPALSSTFLSTPSRFPFLAALNARLAAPMDGYSHAYPSGPPPPSFPSAHKRSRSTVTAPPRRRTSFKLASVQSEPFVLFAASSMLQAFAATAVRRWALERGGAGISVVLPCAMLAGGLWGVLRGRARTDLIGSKVRYLLSDVSDPMGLLFFIEADARCVYPPVALARRLHRTSRRSVQRILLCTQDPLSSEVGLINDGYGMACF